MNHLFKLAITICTIFLFNACGTPKQITNALADAVVLDSLCAHSFSYQITPGPSGSQYQNITFSAVLANPTATAGKGGVMLLMNVSQANGSGQNLATTSQQPGFETPVTSVYPALNIWTSTPLLTTTYWPNGVYTITVQKWLVGQNGPDKSPCHTYSVTQTIVNP